MVTRVLTVALVGVLVAGSGAFGMTLAQNGKARCPIVVARNAIAAERTAAQDLASILHEVTGATFEIRTPGEVAEGERQIIVGPSSRTRHFAPDVDVAQLGSDGIAIRTVGDRLLLFGGRPRGTINAVSTFLEDVVGCRWWTSTESTIPKKPTLEVEGLNTVYTPKLFSREVFFKDAFEPVFANRLKTNGHFSPIPPERGGHVELIGWCHTFWPLLPPEKHFAEHPEWYSEINGKRTYEGAQICLTNEEARKELTRNVLALLRAQPDARLISVAQNDWGGQCQCAACRAVEAEEGSPSGPIIRFVNAVAEEVEREFPDVLVETLAYSYTRKPPAKVHPRDNVVVRLCSIECDFSKPLSSEANKDFLSDIEAWSAISKNLYIWNYVVNFPNFLQPHPNHKSWGDDVRLFVDHGAVSVFEQGDAYSHGGDLNELRAWVMAHLLWDPSRDNDALIAEFVEGYYGPAAPHIMRYLDLMDRAVQESGVRLPCYMPGTNGWLPLATLNEATQALRDAQAAAGADHALQTRLRRFGLPVQNVWLSRYHELKREASVTKQPFLGPDDAAEGYAAFEAALTEFGTGFYGEGRALDGYLPALKRRCAPRKEAAPPAECVGLADDQWLDVQDTEFMLHGAGQLSDLVDDPAASDGGAAWMPGSIPDWAIQWHPQHPELFGQRWHVYVVARCDPAADEGRAFQIGLYDGPNNTGLAQQMVPLADAGDGAYHTYDLGVHELRAGRYVWVAPPNSTAVNAVYVDRVFVVREG